LGKNGQHRKRAKLGKIAPKTVQNGAKLGKIGQNWAKLHQKRCKTVQNWAKIGQNWAKMSEKWAVFGRLDELFEKKFFLNFSFFELKTRIPHHKMVIKK
jgi:hypothetical protein